MFFNPNNSHLLSQNHSPPLMLDPSNHIGTMWLHTTACSPDSHSLCLRDLELGLCRAGTKSLQLKSCWAATLCLMPRKAEKYIPDAKREAEIR